MSSEHKGIRETAIARDSVVQRLLAILEACAEKQKPMTITSLVRKTGLPKSTVHRMCWKLAELGILTHEAGEFTVGAKIIAIGSSSPAFKRLRATAVPHLVDLLRVAGASQLSILNGTRALVVDGMYTRELRAYPLLGGSMPLHCTATGKALLAKAEPEEREHLLNSIRLSYATSRTIVRAAKLRIELEEVCKLGYATCVEEFQSGIMAVAAAFKIGEGATAAIGTLGNIENSAVRRSIPDVLEAARKLECALAVEPRCA